MRPASLLVAVVTLFAAGGAAAQSSYGTYDHYSPLPPPPAFHVKMWVDGFDLLVFRGPDMWLEHHEGARPAATMPEATLYVNGRTWTPTFEGGPNATCPCRSSTYLPPEGGLPHDPQVRAHEARGVVTLTFDPSTGVTKVSLDDRRFDGGAWYRIEIGSGGYYPGPDPHHDDGLKIRLLADGLTQLVLQGTQGWLEIPSGHPLIPATEPILYLNDNPIDVVWPNHTAAAECPCKSLPFPLGMGDDGVPKDARGAIYHYEGRGPVRIVEQPADGAGIFRVQVDDSPYESPAWYLVKVGPDPAYEPACYTQPNADGSYPSGAHPCGAGCPPPPSDFHTWSEDAKRRWYESSCRPAYPCEPLPPESANWTQERRDAWVREKCAPPPPHCSPPPEAKYWNEYDRRAWFERNCAGPTPANACSFPPDARYWSDQQMRDWAMKYCPPAPSSYCPPPPPEAYNWTPEEKHRWAEANCRTKDASTTGDPLRDIAEQLRTNETMRNEAQRAVDNATGDNKIVVPGFEVVAAIGGLGAVALAAGRRRRG